MRHTALLILLIAPLVVHPALADPDANGLWQRGDGNARVAIGPCGRDLCATNVWIKDASGGEAVGDRLVMSVAPVDGDTLSGKAYDSKRDMTFRISIKVAATRLVTRGCVVGGLLCKSMSWARVSGD